MTTLLEPTNSFVKNFETTPGHARPWVNDLRKSGMETFRRLGFPTTKQEEWRDTNISPLTSANFTPAPVLTGQHTVDLFDQYTFGNQAAAELVFINGHYDPHLSTISKLPPGVRVLSLEMAFSTDAPALEKHLGKYAKISQHPFAALNTSFVREGAFVHIARNAVCEKPIHLLFLTIAENQTTATHPRILVIAEENSESSVVETYAGTGTSLYLTNAVTEIVQAKNARIDHNKLQQEGEGAYHTALMQVNLAETSLFVSHSTSTGSRLTRNDLQVFLGGEGAEATLNGLVLAKGEQHIDNHTLLHHEKAHCPSHELYKHVLADGATGVFKGKIFVQKDAQKTDSKQTSKSLLLSDTAFMNSQPALEIYADDVKCTHGSTIGPVDENAVFYLISRGLSLAQARHLMTYAFAADITRRIKVAPVRARIEDFMAAQHGLPQDLRITDEARHDVALI
ncbi:MAG: Fe-S cluster assembly protein SufD [Phycisphaerae bacterium]